MKSVFLENKNIARKDSKQKPENELLIYQEKVNRKEKLDRTSIVSWMFLIGSLIFQMDAIIELEEGFSIHVLLHLSASLLFVVGSIFFMLDARQK